VAALASVVGAVRDGVGSGVTLTLSMTGMYTDIKKKTYRVATAVDAELGGHCDGSAEEKESVESIKDHHQKRVKLE
jgi:hypothetical protein